MLQRKAVFWLQKLKNKFTALSAMFVYIESEQREN
jgi:hypothetical protein